MSKTRDLSKLGGRTIGTAAGNIPVLDSNAQLPVLAAPHILHVQQSHLSGTNGGTTSTGGWQKRPLNTEKINTVSGAEFNAATGVITLPAGTYMAVSTQAFNTTGRVSARLRNTTDSISLILSPRQFVATGEQGICSLHGTFSLDDTADIELQYSCNNGQSGSGLGLAMSTGEAEIYAELVIEKIG